MDEFKTRITNVAFRDRDKTLSLMPHTKVCPLAVLQKAMDTPLTDVVIVGITKEEDILMFSSYVHKRDITYPLNYTIHKLME